MESDFGIDMPQTEIGFLLLENCDVLLDSENFTYETWIDISFKENFCPLISNSKSEEVRDCNVSPEQHVLLESKSSEKGDTTVVLNSYPRFDGTLMNVTQKTEDPNDNIKRSDASLLLGLAFTCQDYKQIKIEKMQVMFHRMNEIIISKRKQPVLHAIALVITISLPSFITTNNSQRKELPPCTRLLFALLRSDWEYLNRSHFKKYSLKEVSRANDRTRGVSFFPHTMSLEELYKRIHFREAEDNESICNQKNVSQLLMLPHELLHDHICSFLKAKSLHSFRRSCRYLNQNVKSVVPGLRLRLYNHQVRSLEWMRSREARHWSENQILSLKNDVLSTDSDCYKAATAGSILKLQTRQVPHIVYRLDTRFGTPLKNTRTSGQTDLSRKVARGGLLCDDPGLGKTITVISLILQTIGLSSESSCPTEEEEKSHICDQQVFEIYWREQVAPFFQRESLNRLIMKLQRLNIGSGVFRYPVDPINDDCPDYHNIIDSPMCFNDIISNISKDCYVGRFLQFEQDVSLIFSNAMRYNPPNHEIHDLANSMLHNFQELLVSFKNKQIQTAKKSFSNAAAHPRSSVARLLASKQRKEFMESLLPSASNLIVVPVTLLNHWEEQIRKHVNTSYITDKKPRIFKFQSNSSRTNREIQEIRLKSTVLNEEFPLLFIDLSGNAALPDPDFLALFSIILTTTKRFSYEWKNGSFEEELRQNNNFAASTHMGYSSVSPTLSPCPLLKIHFTRLVVDEGHSMGRSKQSNTIQFASWISASKRWSITGTPTPQTSTRSGLSNLHGLISFLKHDFFNAWNSGEQTWQEISRSWNEGSLASFFQIKSLLSLLMIRHTKLDIVELPAPVYKRTWLEMSNDEVQTFNTLASAMQSNLLLTSMKGKTSGQQDSLLHKSQSKHARRAFENLRLACSGGLRVVPQILPKHWDETMELLKMHNMDWVSQKIVRNYMLRAITEQRSHCMLCGIELSTLLVVPCGHLVCTECVKPETTACIVCKSPFDVDDFQRLQPGMDYQWYDYYKQERKTKSGYDSIFENQETPSEQALDSLSGQVALQPVLVTRRRNKRGDGHECIYDRRQVDGKCTLCHEEHEECLMIDEGSRCSICHRQSECCPTEESKFYHIIERLNQLLQQQKKRSQVFPSAAESFAGEEIGPVEQRELKVIIFSQFRKVLNLVGHRLIRRYGAGAVAEFWGSYRRKELNKFMMSRSCFCMLLSKDGSEGLDLSFVTNIFFLEEIWDKSLQDQAVARAWRMGAKGHVEVETLSAKYSVESLMTKVDKLIVSSSTLRKGEDSRSPKNVVRSKMVYILENLRLIGRKAPSGKRAAEESKSRSKKRLKVQFMEPAGVGK